MKKIIGVFILAVALLLVGNISFAIDSELVGKVKAESVNFETNKIVSDTVEMYVRTNSGISLVACKSSFPSSVDISPERVNDLTMFLSKGLEWSKQAKKLKVNVEKKIGSINKIGWDTNVLVVRFTSDNKGKDVRIALLFYRTETLTCIVGLDNNQTSSLLDLIREKRTVAYKRLIQAKNNEEYFK